MTEYIIENDPTRTDWQNAEIAGGYILDEIVRCRDCKLFDDTEPAGCTMFDFATPNQSNGFCAWGERK